MGFLERIGLEDFETEDALYLIGFYGPTVAIALALLLIFIAFVMAFGEALIERLQSPKLFTLRMADPPPGKSRRAEPPSRKRQEKDPAQKKAD